MSKQFHSRGFTLIELLIALGLMAIFSLLAYRGLDSVLRLEDAAKTHTQKSADVMRTFTQLEADFRQADSVQWQMVADQELVWVRRRAQLDVQGSQQMGTLEVTWSLQNGVLTRQADGLLAQLLPNTTQVAWFSYQTTPVPTSFPWTPQLIASGNVVGVPLPMSRAILLQLTVDGRRFEKAFLIGR